MNERLVYNNNNTNNNNTKLSNFNRANDVAGRLAVCVVIDS